MPRDDALVADIIVAAKRIRRFVMNRTFEEFQDSEELQSAILWQIGIIGEAARKVTDSFKEEHPDIPWYEMVGMRNRLVHDYSHIDLAQVWDTVKISIPDLILRIEPLAPETD